MKQFKVVVVRTYLAHDQIMVQAQTEAQAIKIAEQISDDTDYLNKLQLDGVELEAYEEKVSK